MTRTFRQTVVVLLILLWNTAGVYGTVCQVRCDRSDYLQEMAQPSPGRIEHSKLGAVNEPAHSDSQCHAGCRLGKCVTVPSQQHVQPANSYPQPLLAEVAPAALVGPTGTGSSPHSPPRFSSGRSICKKLTLLRI